MTPCSFYGLLVITVNCPLVTAAMLFYAKVGKREVEWKWGGGERGMEREREEKEGESYREKEGGRGGGAGGGAVCKTAGRLHKR